MRGRLFFWFIIVPFCLFFLPKYWPVVLIAAGGIVVAVVIMAFRNPGGTAQPRGYSSRVCGAWTSRMKGPCGLRAGHGGARRSR